MAFTNAERVQIRTWLGYTLVYNTINQSLENQMNIVQGVVDGGSQSDTATEEAIRVVLQKLQRIDDKLMEIICSAGVTSVDEVQVDAARGLFILRSVGRGLVRQLSGLIGVAAIADPFGLDVNRWGNSGRY